VILTNIPNGAAVFVDANTLVFQFAPDPVYGPACQQFLGRIDRQEIVGFTTTHVLSDVAHRLMTLEAITQFAWPIAGIAQRLRKNPAELRKLTNFRNALRGVRTSKIQILPTSLDLVVTAADVSQQHALLSGDALIVAVMQANSLTNLASADSDFDRVPGIMRYAPA
jgi:predicted nucleic acid-binding protein